MQTFSEIAPSIKKPTHPKGKIVLAMTKGEVHDIGKTVIKGLFLHNNYEVIDLKAVDSAEPILKAIEECSPDVIGLSAMLNSSLGQMQKIARELSEAGIDLPLLIGGASTTLAHTAYFIAPEYKTGVTIHVKDVQYCQEIIHELKAPQLLKERIEVEYAEARKEYRKTQQNKKILSFKEAKQKGLAVHWSKASIIKPSFLGTRIFKDYDLEDVLGCMDWTTLFMAYSMKGKFPSILRDKQIGHAAQKIHEDGQQFLKDVLKKKLLRANAVIGFFPANSVGDDIEIYANDKKYIYHTLRQQAIHASDNPYYALSDFVAPKETGIQDYVGMFLVTAGIGLKELIVQYEQEEDYYRMIMAKSIADILAESFAERLHQRVRKEFWGYAPDEDLTIEEIFQCRFQGIRPAPGYPACPDHSEKPLLFDVLNSSDQMGVRLTETFAMDPAPSICGVYFAHPAAKYFWIGALGDDQLADYAGRKGETLKETKKRLVFHVTSV